MKKAETAGEYIKGAPKWAQATLRDMRKAIRSVSPKLEEKISYGMPYFHANGRVAYIGFAKAHTSFFWISSADKKEFETDFAKFTVGGPVVVGQTLRIPQGAKPPLALIKKIVRARMKQNEAKALS